MQRPRNTSLAPAALSRPCAGLSARTSAES